MNRKWAWGTLAALAGIGAYAVWIEPRWLQVRRATIYMRHLPRDLDGFRVALLTDLHAGRKSHFNLIRRAVALAMREQPDLIAVTGDFAADDARDFTDVFDALRELDAPVGVYAVPGNHDYVVGIEKWWHQIKSSNLTDLTNRFVQLEVGDTRLCIAGVDDYYRGRPELILPPPDERDITILLAHSPDQAERCRRASDSIDLIVCGHTHAGQVRIPFIGPPLSSAEHAHLYQEGLRRRPWTQVYISRGIGTVHFPVRLLARPEVAVLDLRDAARPALSPGEKFRQRMFSGTSLRWLPEA